MDKQTKQMLAWVGAIVIATRSKQKEDGKKIETPSQENTNNSESQKQPATDTTKASSDIWSGNLKTSDATNKGNLMLITAERTIYIKTSRDYNSLIGKKVRVSYSGSLQSFVLGDITLQED